MPKTIIKIKTWGCDCGYRQDFEPTPELTFKHHGHSDNICPACKNHQLDLVQDEDSKITLTIVGEEEIEKELAEIQNLTEEDKNKYRQERKKEIHDAIKNAKLLT